MPVDCGGVSAGPEEGLDHRGVGEGGRGVQGGLPAEVLAVDGSAQADELERELRVAAEVQGGVAAGVPRGGAGPEGEEDSGRQREGAAGPQEDGDPVGVGRVGAYPAPQEDRREPRAARVGVGVGESRVGLVSSFCACLGFCA